MAETTTPPRFFIVGPTASGKGRLAALVALRAGGEVVSCDSMKLYRGMDIGTATPPSAARLGVPFHLFDVREPWEPMSAAIFCREAARAEAEILARGKVPIFSGGTALYVRALTEGLFEGPEADPELRRRMREEARTHGPARLHARLAEVDPAAAARLHPNDLRRVIRALEVWERTGTPISELQQQWRDAPRADRTLVGVRWGRQALYARIDARVDRMMAEGFVDEVRRLLAQPQGLGQQASQALGYRELVRWIGAGEAEPLEEITRRIQRDTRHFARRQLTFFAHLPDVHWVDVDEQTSWEALADSVVRAHLAARAPDVAS
jgi:tRNA dimethylallyltransferase